jgi:hypothetical protein
MSTPAAAAPPPAIDVTYVGDDKAYGNKGNQEEP